MTIRTAIIGYGLAGSVFHTPLVTADDSYSLDAIVVGNPERAAAAAAKYPAARILGSVDELIADAASFDLVIVAAPTPNHAELGRRCIGAGLATVVDKPLAVHLEDAERMIEEAERTAVPLTVFQNRRFDGDFLTVAALLEEGSFGEVYRFESRFEWLNPRARPAWKSGTAGADGGGVAYDLGAHLIDQAIQLFGPVADFYGELDTHREGGINDDDSFIALNHESGVRSHLGMSSLVAQRGMRFRVLGSKAAYTKWGLDQQEPQLTAGIDPRSEEFGLSAPETYGLLGTDSDRAEVPTSRGQYTRFYGELARAIETGAPVPIDPRDALAGIRIIEALHRAA